MPKQGQFAKASRQVHQKTLKQRGGRRGGQEIVEEQAGDFLLVRFALTTKKRLPKESQETLQRFLQELTPELLDSGDGAAAVRGALDRTRGQVPWQYYYQLSAGWPLLSHFIARELPAIPLKQRRLVKNLPDGAALAARIAALLATQAAALTLLQAKPAATAALAQQLTGQLLVNGKIDWRRVAALLAPFPFTAPAGIDAGTAQWLAALSRVKVAD